MPNCPSCGAKIIMVSLTVGNRIQHKIAEIACDKTKRAVITHDSKNQNGCIVEGYVPHSETCLGD